VAVIGGSTENHGNVLHSSFAAVAIIDAPCCPSPCNSSSVCSPIFAHRKADDWTGRLIDVLTLTPYDCWRRAHAAHHASVGNLDERGVGDITTLTVAEYHSLSRLRRLGS
jgi:hypothetical protein